jgi:hypothetical protein
LGQRHDAAGQETRDQISGSGIEWQNMVKIEDPASPGKLIEVKAPIFRFTLQFCWQEVLPDISKPQVAAAAGQAQ